MGNVVAFYSPERAAFERGSRKYHGGQPCPQKPHEDDPCTSLEGVEYLGWMTARALEMTAFIGERERAMRLLEVPITDADLSRFDIDSTGIVRYKIVRDYEQGRGEDQ